MCIRNHRGTDNGRRRIRAGYYRPDCPTVENLVEDADDVLFRRVLNDQHHLLHSLLPDKNSHGYDLRRRRHDRILSHNDDQRNFVHKFINTVVKHFFLYLIAFWQFLINEYVMLCYVMYVPRRQIAT